MATIRHLSLSPARIQVLQQISKEGPLPWSQIPKMKSDTWSALENLGLIQARHVDIDWHFSITPAGKDALALLDHLCPPSFQDSKPPPM